jgi:hypothetical protein
MSQEQNKPPTQACKIVSSNRNVKAVAAADLAMRRVEQQTGARVIKSGAPKRPGRTQVAAG